MLVDLVKVYATTLGRGPIVLGAPVPSFRGVTKLADATEYSYSIQTGSKYEFGVGTYFVADQSFTRSVIDSSDGGQPIDLPPNAVITFTALARDYAGSGGPGAPAPVRNLSDTLYQLDPSVDPQSYLRFLADTDILVTVPDDTVAIPVNTVIAIEQGGLGKVTVDGGPGVAINSRAPGKSSAGRFAVIQLKKVAPNLWTLLGDMS